MMTEILLALLLPPLMLVGWAAVQIAWRRVMRVDGDEDDVLALRGGGCGTCACTGRCERKTH